MSSKAAWLIEGQNNNGEPIYFTCPAVPAFTGDWSTNADDALRFSRKVDAEMFRRRYLPGADCEATEHMWVDTDAPTEDDGKDRAAINYARSHCRYCDGPLDDRDRCYNCRKQNCT